MNNYNTILTQQEYATLRLELNAMGVTYEASQCGENVCLALACTANQANAIKQIIDTI